MSTAKSDLLARRVDELRGVLLEANPVALESRTGATFLPAGLGKGTFYLSYWRKNICLTFPEFIALDEHSGTRLSVFDHALLAYYFSTADGQPESGRWIAFSELPDGKFYTQAFQGYTGDQLVKVFGNDADGFSSAAQAAGGMPVQCDQPVADLAFRFRVLPHVPLLVVCWLGDEDFAPSYRILFDAAVSHHLSTDACAILGSALTRRLVKAYQAQQQPPAYTLD